MQGQKFVIAGMCAYVGWIMCDCTRASNILLVNDTSANLEFEIVVLQRDWKTSDCKPNYLEIFLYPAVKAI